MWPRVKSPVYLMLFAVAVLVADLVLERFAHVYLVYMGFHVYYAAPVLFAIGLIWLVIRLVQKPKAE